MSTPDLRERVLRAAVRVRPPGRPAFGVTPCRPMDAFTRAADRLDDRLCRLTAADWHYPVRNHADVQALVGHLTGVEADLVRCLSGNGADVADADHLAATRAAASRQSGRDPAETRAEWLAAVAATRAALARLTGRAGGQDPDPVLAIHRLRLPLSDLLVVRAFELWTHDGDIAAAIGAPVDVPDPESLVAMTGLAARMLPRAVAAARPRRSGSVRLVLTGPCGGTTDIAVGEGFSGRPDAVIVTDAVGFCRLAADRTDPADLAVEVLGDPGLANLVLAATPALALD